MLVKFKKLNGSGTGFSQALFNMAEEESARTLASVKSLLNWVNDLFVFKISDKEMVN